MMDKRKYLKLQAEKKLWSNYASGTGRLVFVALSGLLGIVYLVLFVTELVAGKIEIRPAQISINQIEAEGFPQANYLNVQDAYFIFSEAGIKPKNQGTELNYLAVPVVSQSLMEQWKKNSDNKEPIDGAQFRLYVIFTGQQVENLWPDNTMFLTPEAGWLPVSNQITITGETGPAKWSLFKKPMKSQLPKKNINWEEVRYLKYEKHTYSLARSIRHFTYAAILLVLAVFVLMRHMKRHDPIPDGTPDYPGVYDNLTSNDSIDPDI